MYNKTYHKRNETPFFPIIEESKQNIPEKNIPKEKKLTPILHKFKKNKSKDKEYSFFNKSQKNKSNIVNNPTSPKNFNKLAISKDIKDTLIVTMPNIQFKKASTGNTESNLQNSTTIYNKNVKI